MIDKLRVQSEESLLIVDAGNLLSKVPLPATKPGESSEVLIAAHGIVRAYKEMSYDAVAISYNDLFAGYDFFTNSAKEGFPWISANLFDSEQHLLVQPHIVKEIAGLKVGIVGLTGTGKHTISPYLIGDWRTALSSEIALLGESCDLLVLLSTLNSSENHEIQREFSQLDIIVGADKKGSNTQPLVVNNGLWLQSGGRGKYLGKLEATIKGEGPWKMNSSTLQQLHENKLRLIDYQISRLKEQSMRVNVVAKRKLDQLNTTRQKLIENLADLEAGPSNNKEEAQKTYQSSFLAVKPSASGKNIDQIVQEIKRNIATFNKFRNSVQQQDDPALSQALLSNEIRGVATCAKCHLKQFQFWQSTGHSRAYETLSNHGQSYNLSCLPCHVTPGTVHSLSSVKERLSLLALPNDRMTIGCEVCHGPGSQHLKSPGATTSRRRPAETICTQCHTPERDANFDYLKKLALIACPAE